MIRKLEPRDQTWVHDLLLKNPHKQDQIRFQHLNSENLAGFHAQRIMDRTDDASRPILICEKSNKYGLCGIKESKSHSSFFHKLVFSISPVLTYNLKKEQKESLLEETLKEPLLSKADVLWIQFVEEESDWFSILGNRGGSYCGTDLRLTLRLKGPYSGPGNGIRLAREEDLERLESIVKKGHRHSHFFKDPFLDSERKGQLFPEYLRNSFGRSNRILWVAEDEGGEPQGFSLLILPENQESALGRKIGIVDFIVVDPDAQGQGVGNLLLERSHQTLEEKGYEYVELKTMLDNRAATNFYQRNGYRLVSSEAHFSLGLGGSKWY